MEENKVVETKADETEKKEETKMAEETKKEETKTEKKTEEKKGIGPWLKKHWKGVTAGAVAIGGGIGSAFVAYRKGKSVGVAQTVNYYEQPQQTSPLDPNVEN